MLGVRKVSMVSKSLAKNFVDKEFVRYLVFAIEIKFRVAEMSRRGSGSRLLFGRGKWERSALFSRRSPATRLAPQRELPILWEGCSSLVAILPWHAGFLPGSSVRSFS